VALLAGREIEPPTFDSVCYSLLGPESAVAIRGHFSTQEGRIVALESALASAAVASAQQAQEAQRWYRSIRADAFGS